MSPLFEITDQLHTTASECVLQGMKTSRVASAAFRHFTTALAAFEKRLHECGVADDWIPLLGFLKLSRLRYATTPLKASCLVKTTRVRGTSAAISRLLDAADTATQKLYQELDEAFQSLLQEEVNPLWTQFIESQAPVAEDPAQFGPEPLALRTSFRKIGILCFWNDLAGEIEALVASAEDRLGHRVSVVRPPQLKEFELFDEVVIFGSLRWLERRGWSFVYDAPRARLVRAYCFSDIPDYQPVFYQLEGSPHTFPGAAASSPRTAHGGFTSVAVGWDAGGGQGSTDGAPVAPPKVLDEMLPSLDLDRVSRSSATAPGSDDSDRIDSALMELSGASAVWLNPEGKVYRLDLHGVGRDIQCLNVTHVDVGEVSPGDVLLFSTAGGGDMIAEEANRLMGDRAGAARQIQARWKRELASLVKRQGLDWVCETLKAAGVAIAAPHNVRHWLNPDSIAPKKPEHFRVVLTECGLNGEITEIENATALIRKAHQVAGMSLSRKLRQLIKGRSLAGLADRGHQVFGGDDAIASEKTAYVVESVSQDTRPIPTSELAKPFTIEDDLWR